MQTKALDELVSTEAAARLLAYRQALQAAFPGALREVILFGSRARGDAGPSSDFDVAVVLPRELALDRNARRRLSDAAWEHVVDGYPIVPVALDADELADDSPLRSELGARVATDGIRIG